MGVSYEQFKESIQLAKALKKVESKYSLNPNISQQALVKGLKGGAAVLMVAAFEFFLRKLFEENISRLNATNITLNFNKLPKELKIHSIFHGLEGAMKGPYFSNNTKKIDRIPEILKICGLIVKNKIISVSFSETGGNPDGRLVKEKFKEVGIKDIFSLIKVQFEKKWNSPVPDTFIKDKLDGIVSSRHTVAHTADTLHITRKDQREAFKFLNILAQLLEKELIKYINKLIKIAKI